MIWHSTLPRSRAPRRGYTMVELLMSLAVLSVGVAGIVSMQRIAIRTNRYARQMATATQIAQAWQSQLAADASAWDGTDAGAGGWLSGRLDQPKFFGASWDGARAFGAAFEVDGQPIDASSGFFCAHYRLKTILLPVPGSSSAVVRADVRVMWPRQQTGTTACTGDASAFDDDVANYQFVYLTTTLLPGLGP